MTIDAHRKKKAKQKSRDQKRDKLLIEPSTSLSTFLTLTKIARSMSDFGDEHDAVLEPLHSMRDLEAVRLARRKAESLNETFEKLYIWRTEAFKSGESGFIYFDDLFPLSAYFDLKTSIELQIDFPADDSEVEHNLRRRKHIRS